MQEAGLLRSFPRFGMREAQRASLALLLVPLLVLVVYRSSQKPGHGIMAAPLAWVPKDSTAPLPDLQLEATSPDGCHFHPSSSAAGTTFEVLPAWDPGSCLARCGSVTHCAGFVYSVSTATCWLKRELGPLVEDSDSVTWPRCQRLDSQVAHMAISKGGEVEKWALRLQAGQREEDNKNLRRGEYDGPRKLCNYTEAEVEAFLAAPHNCMRKKKRIYIESRWMRMEDFKAAYMRLEDGADPVVCAVVCMHNMRPCREGKCLLPFYLRRGDSDSQVALQMLHYGLLEPVASAALGTILDAGSNFGFGAAIFATMYPNATIVSIEPASSSFAMLGLNTVRFRNVIRVHAGLWPRPARLNLVQQGRFGGSVSGAWTIQVLDSGQVGKDVPVLDTLQGVSVPFLLHNLGLPGFDLAKIDVEGSEKDIFEQSEDNDLSWLDNAKIAVIEIHEDMRAGAERAVKDAFALRKDRWQFHRQEGEELFFVTPGIAMTS